MYLHFLALRILYPCVLSKEAFGMMVHTLGVTAYEALGPFVGRTIVAGALLYAIFAFFRWRWRVEVPALRVQSLLECTRAEAKEIHAYLDEVGISWNRYHSWVVTCVGKLMPLLSFRQNPYDDQLVATWGESKAAMLKLSLEKRLDPTWSTPDAVGAASGEIIRMRMAKGSTDVFRHSRDDNLEE